MFNQYTCICIPPPPTPSKWVKFYTKVVPVNISCTRTEFSILIAVQSLPQLDRESIYLGNPSCTAQLTATSYKILARFVNCGTAGQVDNAPSLHIFCCQVWVMDHHSMGTLQGRIVECLHSQCSIPSQKVQHLLAGNRTLGIPNDHSFTVGTSSSSPL